MIETGHYYTQTGEPAHFVPKKTGGGTRSTNITDARKLGLLPSVTTVLKTLNKPALNSWLIKQAVMAVVTAPTLPGESIDDKLVRVLEVEKQQDQESQIARDMGTQIHEALELAIMDKAWDHSLEAFVRPILEWRVATGNVVWTEQVLVGDGYAGKADLLLDNELLNVLILTDFKTTSKLPEKDSWLEHKLQTAAYAKAMGNTGDKRIVTCNVYLSTKTPGQYAVFTQTDWPQTYACGFKPLLDYWCWSNNYYPGRNNGPASTDQ